MSTENARIEFERLKAEMPRLGRGWTHMKKEAADQVSDERLRANLIDPVKFRAMIEARERMGQAAHPGGEAGLHPVWEKSNAKLHQLFQGANHGQL